MVKARSPARLLIHKALLALLALSVLFFVNASLSRADPREVSITMAGHIFRPGSLHARPGDRVIFRNDDNDLHSLTLAGHEDLMDEVYLDPGHEYALMIPEEMRRETLELRCHIHIAMKGEIVVD